MKGDYMFILIQILLLIIGLLLIFAVVLHILIINKNSDKSYVFKVNDKVISYDELFSMCIDDYEFTLKDLIEGVEIENFVSEDGTDFLRLESR